jgi:NAD(P)H-nitrite reductase large subunit
MPQIPGIQLEGITTLQSMQDADYLRKIRDEGKIKKAVVIGGGLIGLETLEALHLAGIELTLIELLPQLLTFLDWKMAKLVENYLKTKSNVITKNGVAEFIGEKGKLTGVKLRNGTEVPCELAVVAIGVKPNINLAREAGMDICRLPIRISMLWAIAARLRTLSQTTMCLPPMETLRTWKAGWREKTSLQVIRLCSPAQYRPAFVNCSTTE